MSEEKVGCRTPAEGRDGVTNIPKWKFDAIRAILLDLVRDAGPEGYKWSDMSGAVAEILSADQLERLGKVGWHTISVKLELEVRGELKRLDAKGPQRVVLGDVNL